jgi:hypothetical protein
MPEQGVFVQRKNLGLAADHHRRQPSLPRGLRRDDDFDAMRRHRARGRQHEVLRRNGGIVVGAWRKGAESGQFLAVHQHTKTVAQARHEQRQRCGRVGHRYVEREPRLAVDCALPLIPVIGQCDGLRLLGLVRRLATQGQRELRLIDERDGSRRSAPSGSQHREHQQQQRPHAFAPMSGSSSARSRLMATSCRSVCAPRP